MIRRWISRFSPRIRRSRPDAAVPAALASGRPWPKISVVTVTLNQGRYLEATIRSVLTQAYPNLEYILVDGGSTDGTPQILDRYRHQLARCIVERDDGQADALDKAFRLATGDILAWLNSDDRYLPGALAAIAQAFDRFQTDIVVGGCGLCRGDDPAVTRVHHSRFPAFTPQRLPLDGLLDVDGCWLKGHFFWQPEVFWSRSIWERSGGYVAKELYYCMDYDLWVRMARAGATIVRIPDAVAAFRFHDRQKTSGDGTPPYVPELRRVAAMYLT